MSGPSSGEPELLHHEYDGIQEYDNPLPGWWKAVFVATIVFAIGYGAWFLIGGDGTSDDSDFERDWQAYAAWKAEAEQHAQVVVTEASLAAATHESGALDAGRQVFTVNCVGCHREDAGGKLGPNLTDDYQIHGVDRLAIYKTIRDGVPDKGMLSWGMILQPRDVAAVAGYVSSLRGSNVVGGKGPDGGKVEPLAP